MNIGLTCGQVSERRQKRGKRKRARKERSEGRHGRDGREEKIGGEDTMTARGR